MLICFGVTYTFAAFFQALQREFNATRADVSLIFSLAGFLYFSLGAVSGPLADRVGPRWIVAGGLFLIALGLVLASQAQTLWQVYLTYGLSVGLGVGLAYVPSVGAVQRWFVRKRGMASGLATAGIGVGTLVMPPFASFLTDGVGWRGAYLILAAITALAGITAALLIEHSPQRRGLLPDGDRPKAVTETDSRAGRVRVVHVGGATIKEGLTSRAFWLLYLASFASAFGLFIPFVHLTPFVRDHGMPETTGVLLVGLIGVGSTAGRFILGGWADRLGRRNTVALMFGGMALMLGWWLIFDALWALVIFALVFGMCYGGFVAVVPALTADYFGARNAGSLIGFLYTSVSFGTLLGPTLAGAAYDISHTYALPIAASALANLFSVVCIVMAPRPGSHHTYVTTQTATD
jgi:MFS family permease